MAKEYQSTDDQRTQVGNATRHQYRKLTDEKGAMWAVKGLTK